MKTNLCRILPVRGGGPMVRIILFLLGATAAVPAGGEPEYRILWVDGWGRELRTESSIRQVVADAREAGFNAIFPTMRRRGEVFYQSDIEPLAKELQPGFDPLAVLLEEARAEEPVLEIHPWMVTFPIWNQESVEPVQSNHPFFRSSDWLMKDWDGNDFVAGNYWADPGHPETHAYLEALIAELVENYPVDGVHFDMIRYADQPTGYNEHSLERFRALYDRSDRPSPTDVEWSEFRRAQVTDVLRKLRMTIKSRRPEAVVSAATIAWGSGPSGEGNWLSSNPTRNVYQDWMNWMKDGLLDLNAPMVYKDADSFSEDFQWQSWNRFAKDIPGDCLLAIGVGGYKNSVPNSIQQIKEARAPTSSGNTADGVGFFSYRSPTDTEEAWADLSAALIAEGSVFEEPAVAPEAAPFLRPDRGNLSGRLRSPVSRNFLPDVTVLLAGPDIGSTRTDAGGFFLFEDYPSGSYRLMAEPGLEGLGGDSLLQFWRGSIPPEGSETIPDISRTHPSDADADGRITAREFGFFAAGHFADRSGFGDALFRRARAIWRSGERYRYEDSALPPASWVIDHPESVPFTPVSPDEGEAGTLFVLFGDPPDGGGPVALRTRDGSETRTVPVVEAGEGGWGFVAPEPFPDPSADAEVFVEFERNDSRLRAGPILLKAP